VLKVIDPLPLVMVTPALDPAVSVATDGLPAVFPIKSCPSVFIAELVKGVAPAPPPIMMPLEVRAAEEAMVPAAEK
jgi:hypothetical protein